ncbi:hypothetical protein SBV1_2060006 [Verrucomicrobia bacterium]|nr:hypothetical protein SBV1_2060006 [Verrucomicrobiota bacterium]
MSIGQVYCQNINRRPADRRAAHKQGAFPFEMLLPLVLARIKQARHFLRLWIKAAQIGPLVIIASKTGQSQILGSVGAVVLPGNYVLDLKAQLIEFLLHPAIFTAVARALPN